MTSPNILQAEFTSAHAQVVSCSNTAVERYAHVRDLRKAREKLSQIVYRRVRTEQKHKK